LKVTTLKGEGYSDLQVDSLVGGSHCDRKPAVAVVDTAGRGDGLDGRMERLLGRRLRQRAERALTGIGIHLERQAQAEAVVGPELAVAGTSIDAGQTDFQDQPLAVRRQRAVDTE
jgi:hypothetical protein